MSRLRLFPYLEGWVLATTVENWTKLGYLDERYAPCDYEDIHLSTKALSLGMRLVSLDSPSLYHLGAQTITYGEKREQQTLKNKEIFKNIWVK